MATNIPNVKFMREEVKKLMPQYELISDCIEGERKIKQRRQKYLPIPNAEDVSKTNQERYEAYLTRAVFYNVSQRTLIGLAGQVFSKEPVIEIPTALEIVNIDANGGGISLTQLAKRSVEQTLSLGRAGLFVDYPRVDGPATKEQLEKGDIRPTINVYLAPKIINWRTKTRGAKEILSLVVLEEKYVMMDDGFEMKEDTQYRVLRLSDKDVYSVTIYRSNDSKIFVEQENYIPTDAKGATLDEIPFTFMGSSNNDEQPDLPPMYDLCALNIAHYRNSADYEESCYIVGQPTPYFAGLTQEWVTNVLKGRIPLGSRAAVPLPENGTAGLLQAEPNTMPFEAMEHKEKQMVALGAKLVENTDVQRTATEASIDNVTETSALVSSAKNVSAAFKFALEWCAVFVGIPETGIKFELQTDFAIARMSAEQLAQVVSQWQSNAITYTEMREILRKNGIATLDDETAKNETANEVATADENEINKAAELAKAAGTNIKKPPAKK